MNKQPNQVVPKKAAATLAVFLFLSLIVAVNKTAFEFCGFLDTIPACIVGGGGVLLVGTAAILSRRFLLVPAGGVVALAVLLSVLTWTCPLTPRTQFFARTARVRVRMPVRTAQKLLRGTDIIYVPLNSGAFSPEPGRQLPYAQPDVHCSGFIACKPNSRSGDVVTINIYDGKVTGVHPYANL